MLLNIIRVHRVYDKPYPEGYRILVDRLWPRGIKKEEIDYWGRDIAPTDELREWFGHDKSKWNEFKNRYFQELRNNPKLMDFIEILRTNEKRGILFLYSTRETEMNNAVALLEFIANL